MKRQSADVLIVGGGISGLAAARTLARSGLTFGLLEARDRLGGRVDTLYPERSPIPVELGAEFIHGKPPAIWNIVRELNLPVVEKAGENVCFERNTLNRCNGFWDDWESVSERMHVKANEDVTFKDFIDRIGKGNSRLLRAKKHAIEFVEGFNAAHSDKISVRSLIEDRDASNRVEGSRTFHVVRGYDDVVRYLAAIPPENGFVRLSTIAKSIEWSRGQVRVRALERVTDRRVEFTAKAAIITLPLAIMQSTGGEASMSFVPELPSKVYAARALIMGPVIKAILIFKTPFWADRGLEKLGFLHASGQPFPVFWTTSPLLTPVLTGWAAGRAAEALEGAAPADIREAALQSLAVCFRIRKHHLRSMLQDSHMADWQSDPFARGAYSYTLAGHLGARKSLAKPVEGTLFFAGEATHTGGFSGTVHGAMETGRRAAGEVLTAFRPAR